MSWRLTFLVLPVLALLVAGTLVYIPPGDLKDPSLGQYTFECGCQGVPVERVLWKAGAYPVTGFWAGGQYLDWRAAAYHSRWCIPVLVREDGRIEAFGDLLSRGPAVAMVGPKPRWSILDIAPTVSQALGLRGDFPGRTLFAGNASQVIVLYVDALGWYRCEKFRPIMPNLSKTGEPIVAASVYPSISNVNGAAMLTGLSPEHSGIDRWENRTLLAADVVGQALQQNVTAAWIDGPAPPVSIPAGLVSVCDADGDGSTDAEVTDRAISEYGNGTRLLYVHLTDLDRRLHATGPYSEASRDAAAKTDAQIGRLVSQAKPGTLLIITADHGGHDIEGGRGDHGTLLPDDMLIPVFIRAF